VVGGVAQQDALADAGLAAQDERTASAATGGVEQQVNASALRGASDRVVRLDSDDVFGSYAAPD
jgi:hypothetical protein